LPEKFNYFPPTSELSKFFHNLAVLVLFNENSELTVIGFLKIFFYGLFDLEFEFGRLWSSLLFIDLTDLLLPLFLEFDLTLDLIFSIDLYFLKCLLWYELAAEYLEFYDFKVFYDSLIKKDFELAS
jgi:hypothetical protein